jgi:pilus assembly protein Flp/PilA
MQIAHVVQSLRTAAHRLHEDESGATAIEYALLAMLIALAIVTGVSTIAPKLNTTFTAIAGKL